MVTEVRAGFVAGLFGLILLAGCGPQGPAAPALSKSSADDRAFLDPPYLRRQATIRNSLPGLNFLETAAASDTESVIRKMTAVRNQASRGTCSIFSATGLLEAMLVIEGKFPNTIDLSEEWLEYLVTRNRTSDGSSSYSNFSSYLANGAVEEELMPYLGVTWTSILDFPGAQPRCGGIANETTLQSCLIGHRHPGLLTATDEELTDPESGELYDPEFARIRTRAREFRDQNMAGFGSGFFVNDSAEAKQLLRAGIPLTLDLDFYYGAWNHRLAPEIGAERDLTHWEQGIVGYPEEGSKDRAHSQEKPAGHSVIVVGYDDRVTFTTHVLMEDGTYQDFSYQGVYYFKNSWGTESFGRSFRLNGVPHPGYGVISQRYAEEFGAFYTLPLATTP